MTITDTTPRPLDLRDMTTEELDGLYHGTDNPVTWAAVTRDLDRRDREDRLAESRAKLAAIQAEGERQAYAQYREADRVCCGELLSRAGKAAHDRGEFADETALWRLPQDRAALYCSEELGLFWLHVAPRVTAREYVRQRAAEKRGEYAQARDNRDMEAGNGHDAGTGRPGVAGTDPRPLRREAAAPQAPQAGPGRPVHRGGPHAGDTGGGQGGTADRRAGQPVRRGGTVTGTVAVPAARTAEAGSEPRIPGDQLLDLLRDQWFGFYARFPSPAALDAVTLWAAHCWMRDEKGVLVFRATPRLCMLSSEPGSGKGLVLELLMDVTPNCYGLDLEPTKSGLVHTLNDEHATVLIDEADILFGAGKRKSDVRAVINGGTYRRGTILNGQGGKTNRVPVFGPIAVAGLDVMEKDTGDALDALMSRFVKIRMVKVADDEKPPKRTPEAYESAEGAKVWLERWAAQVLDEVAAARPEFPEGMDGRAEDIWGPLLAVAEAAGGEWPDRARAACRELALGKPDGGENLEDEFAEFAGSFGAL